MIRVLGDTERKETMENNETDVIVEETVELQETVEDVTEEVVEETVEEVVEETVETDEVTEENVEELPTEEPVEETEETPEVTGVITAAKLNVRELPSKDSNVVCVLNKDDIVSLVMDTPQTYEDFYEVVTADGKIGFCMKQFIELK